MHSIHIPTDDDLQQYPHVFFTSPDIWDTSILDHGITPALLVEIHPEADDSLKDCLMNLGILTSAWYSTWMFSGIQSQQRLVASVLCHLHQTNPTEEDLKSLRPYFGWQPEQVIHNTYKATSRFGGTVPQQNYLKQHFKSRIPALNIPRRNEPVATDTVLSDTPAINDGSTMA